MYLHNTQRSKVEFMIKRYQYSCYIKNPIEFALCSLNAKKLHPLSERLVFLCIIGAEMSFPFKPFNTIV